MQQLISLYRQWRGAEPAHVEQLAGAGSNRVYYRFTDADGLTVIGVVGTSRDENHAFISLTRHFCNRQLPVPAILAVADDDLAAKLDAAREKMARQIAEKEAKLQAELD